MEARFTNGSTVNRVWSDTSTELIAAFQYQNDAVAFAQLKLSEDIERKIANSHYIVSCTYSGKIEIIRITPEVAKAA